MEVTDEVLLGAVRRVIPWIEPWELDRQDTEPRPTVQVYGDPSWISRLPGSSSGQLAASVMVARYDLGIAVLLVTIDLRARGDA